MVVLQTVSAVADSTEKLIIWRCYPNNNKFTANAGNLLFLNLESSSFLIQNKYKYEKNVRNLNRSLIIMTTSNSLKFYFCWYRSQDDVQLRCEYRVDISDLICEIKLSVLCNKSNRYLTVSSRETVIKDK